MGIRKSALSAMAKWIRLLSGHRGGRYFHLDLSSRYRWYVAPVRMGLGGLNLLLGVGIVWTIMNTVSAFSDRQAMQARLDQIHEQDRQLIALAGQEGIDLSELSLQRLLPEVDLANQLLVKRNFSWSQFLSGLEEAIPPTVSIKSVRLDPGSAMIHLMGVAMTVEDVTGLALKLRNHPVFRDPVLGEHRTGADGLVEFDLTLKYNPHKA